VSYMDTLARLEGKDRRTVNVVLAATITDSRDAQRIAAARKRTDDDSHDFRAMRSLMHQTHGTL
jgi:hypothetical protein